jgi:glycerol-3-phosphate dehydrogenase
MMESVVHDLLVVGGGINGAGIAADAAGRGLDVVLCEKNDLAAATSSASTKLIHGGLRYLEQYEFRLVREALSEREVLLRKAPHIIHPLRFQLPHQKHLRPRWMIRAGLYLYDFLGKRVTLPRSRAIRFRDGGPLEGLFRTGFEYSDAQVDDARLVILNAVHAREKGASIRPRTECVALMPADGHWEATLRNECTGQSDTLRVRAVVNATGPWVSLFSRKISPAQQAHPIRLVKGCHIVVPRMYEGEEAFMLQNEDGRIVFVIPYHQDFTLIGTTEQEYDGDPAAVTISEQEVTYLLSIVNRYFRKDISESDVVHHYAGVRPLIESEEENASKVSRDYTLELECGDAPLLTVYGGKITTYRRLAEAAMERLREVFPHLGPGWTEGTPLPGGDFDTRDALVGDMCRRWPWLPADLLLRWAGTYGTLARRLVAEASCLADMGEDFGHGLYAKEVEYLIECEWARTTEDILWRRTHLGLRFSREQSTRLAAWLDQRLSP